METKESRNSRFVSIPGLLSLLFFAVLAIYFHAGMVAAFLSFFFLLCFGSRFWSRGVLSRVEFNATAEQSCCHAGEMLTLDLRVRNRSFFPMVWLDVILPTGRKPLMRGEEETEVSWYQLKHDYEPQTGIRERFVWLLWQQEICWQEPVRTLRRGWAEITGAELQAGDGFGLSARHKWNPFSVPLRLMIYPKVVPVTVQPFLKITQEAVARSSGQAEDITILKSSRPYQPGDPMKRINWRVLAGSGRMEVKIFETVTPGCAAFILDLASCVKMVQVEGSAGTGNEKKPVLQSSSLERLISLTASCIQAVTEHGLPAALVIPAYGGQEEVILLPDQENSGSGRYMEALAMLDYQGQETRFPYEEFWKSGHRMGTCYFCSRTDERSVLEDLMDMLGRGRVRRLVLEREGMEAGEYDCLYAEDLILEPLTAD